jgi:hypothetical protein
MPLLILVLCAGSAAAEKRSSDYFRALRETRAPDPTRNDLRFNPASSPAPRVLIAGDSWAQYMWDDGSHNDIFDKFGHGEKRALSSSRTDDPGPGYTGPEYAVGGSQARHWVDTANYPWMSNMVAALQNNASIDLVVLSIGGNDILAGKDSGGWYKDMDLDAPGSEQAFFDRLQQDTFSIIQAALDVRPEIRVVISTYDYPNFNVGFWCFISACPLRRNLSRDPDNDLITDEEINGILVGIEQMRIGWANSDPRILYDHGLGLMHFYYGDGVSGPGVLPHPGQTAPDFSPFPGGNPLRPSLRSNFRLSSGIDADPIHLDYEAYQYKITNETQATFFPAFRGDVSQTFTSEGARSTDGRMAPRLAPMPFVWAQTERRAVSASFRSIHRPSPMARRSQPPRCISYGNRRPERTRSHPVTWVSRRSTSCAAPSAQRSWSPATQRPAQMPWTPGSWWGRPGPTATPCVSTSRPRA